jgi:Lrp/AsnC family transcriptional regulator, cysteine-sensing transcriptional activator
MLQSRKNIIGTPMLDRMDRKILDILQKDCTMPVAEIGKQIGLSTTPCWRRIQKLEESGVIQRRVALLDRR